MTSIDYVTEAVRDRGEQLLAPYLKAAEKGDWRASEALMDRVYGKSETVTRQVETPAQSLVRGMSLDEKLELLRRLRSDAAQTLPTIVDP